MLTEFANKIQTYSRMEYLKRHQRKRTLFLLHCKFVLTLQTRMTDRSSVKTARNRLPEGKPSWLCFSFCAYIPVMFSCDIEDAVIPHLLL